MQRFFALLFSLLLGMALLIGCSRSQYPLAGLQAESPFRVAVVHFFAGQEEKWVLQGEEAEKVLSWAAGLACTPFQPEPGQGPGDAEGGEAYDFTLSGGFSFSYINNGPAEHYLLLDAQWYSVENPEIPPAAPAA